MSEPQDSLFDMFDAPPKPRSARLERIKSDPQPDMLGAMVRNDGTMIPAAENTGCQWLVVDRRQYSAVRKCCGNRRETGSVYCSHHLSGLTV